MRDLTVNRFRAARGARLRARIEALADRLGRDVEILDVGGRPDYWQNVGLGRVARVTLLNLTREELDRKAAAGPFETRIGDARDLSDLADGSVDLVHANSVIEHVGAWDDMARMASELARVGRTGWVQTPAWAFPIEPHYRLPFLHWGAAPVRRAVLGLVGPYRRASLAERRRHVDRINLLTRAEVAALFPEAEIWTERFALLSKSYVAMW